MVIGNYGGNIPNYQLNDSAGNVNSATLPCNLNFNTGSGAITGTPANGCTDTANETYTITVSYGSTSYDWNRNHHSRLRSELALHCLLFPYNPADTTQTYTRGYNYANCHWQSQTKQI